MQHESGVGMVPESISSYIFPSGAGLFAGAGGISTSGNLTLGNISDLKIPGGINGYVIQTDGAGNLSWAAQTGSGNGNPGGANTQVQFNDDGLFGGSNTFTFSNTTSTLSVGNVVVGGLVSAIGNVTANYFIGNGSQLTNLPTGGVTQSSTAPANPTDNTLWWDEVSGRLYVYYTDADGSQWVDAAPAAAASTYGNANVAAYLAAGSVGNIVPSGNAVYSLGNATNQWADLWVSNSTIYINSVPITLGAGNVLQVNGEAVLSNDSNTSITTTGNITADYFIGDGSQLTNLPFDASQIENGTSNVAIATANGNVTITSAGAETWTFGTSGNLRFPDGTTYTGSELVSATVPTVGGLASAGEAGITYLSGDFSKWAIFSENAFTVGVWTDVLIGWTVTDNNGFTDIIAGRGGFGAASFQTTVNNWPAPASGKTYVFTSPDYQPGYTNPVEITVGSSTWAFGNTSTLTLPGGSQLRPLGANLDIFAGAGSYVNLITADESSSMGVDNGGGYIVTAGGTWDFGTTGNLTAPGNISAVGNIVGGNLTVGSGTITGGNVNGAVFNGNVAFGTGTVGGSGNIAGGNISAVGNVTVSGNLTVAGTAGNVATKSSGTWTVPTGNSTQSFTVDGNNTYQMWVEGNIPNGIIAWNALVTITNTNVPVLGQQFAWNYEDGGSPLLLTSIPDQIIGTAGAISNVAPVVANTNVFSFGINNASGSSQTVRYGWIRIS
jgi:hypothetical protein